MATTTRFADSCLILFSNLACELPPAPRRPLKIKHTCGDCRYALSTASMTTESATSLYNPEFERDSCGFGLIANQDDIASHWVVETAIAALARLTHRGAVAADGKTGDGWRPVVEVSRDVLSPGRRGSRFLTKTTFCRRHRVPQSVSPTRLIVRGKRSRTQ